MAIHSTALIDPRAQVDRSAIIGPNVVIEGPVQVGPLCRVAASAVILGNTRIGAGCQIHSHAVIGHIPQDHAFDGSDSYCLIGDECTIREGATIHRGTAPGSATIVGDRCFLMTNSHVAHNCEIGNDVTLVSGALLAGYVRVGARAVISGNAAVHQFVRIGELALISGLGIVCQDVPPFFMTDREGAVVGENRVGLMRAGLTALERKEIKAAFRVIYRSGMGHQAALDYLSGYVSTARGEATATVQPMPGFKNLIRLMAMTYDRGGKIVGMIQDRLGDDEFFGFMRVVYAKYQYRILRVAAFRRELEAYTGRSWQTFFNEWLYGKGMTDWSVEKVRIEEWSASQGRWRPQSWAPFAVERDFFASVEGEPAPRPERYRVTVLLKQKAEYMEQTVVGFSLDGSVNYQVRIPVMPQVPVLQLDDAKARVEMLPDNCVRVQVELPCEPTQVTVDPDQVLLDRNPTNNNWKPRIRWRPTPLYTQLDEVDLTNSYDRWNIIFGPWVYDATYTDPWYTRSAMAGLRLGAYRTQEFSGGAYVAYRSDDRNIVAGVDALWNHVLVPQGQIGLNIERSLTEWDTQDHERASRGVLYERYVILPGSSFYLPPFEYIEAFEAIQSNPLPDPSTPTPGAIPFHQQTLTGLHYHMNLLTPYWNPEAGMQLDTSYAEGLPVLGEHRSLQEFYAQISFAKTLRDLLGLGEDTPFLRWLGDSRLAGRVYAAEALQNEAQVFTLGGGDMFRGYSLSQRQGSMVWLGSVEWRIPLIQRVDWDVLDHVAGVRNVYGAPFYDVGDAYVAGKETGPVAHAVGFGLRIDVAWFSLIERTILRFDIAKTVNDDTPVQFWFGLDHPF